MKFMKIQNNFRENIDSVSVIIPLFNEAGSLEDLFREITSVFTSTQQTYEVIFVNDGSNDESQKILDAIVAKNPSGIVKAIELKRNFGKAVALGVGFSVAKGDIIITMDADLQDDPNEIPRFIEKINEGYDVVSGWKTERKDSFIKNQTSKIYNYFTSLLSGVHIHDHNCGFKAYRSEAIKDLDLYGQLHRYIPVLVSASGYTRIGEIGVHHRKRTFGSTKYGPKRFIHGLLDLLTVFFITKFKSSPLHFFGVMSIYFIGFGGVIGLYLTYLRIIEDATIGNRPLLFLAVLLMVVGIQIGATGLISEQITYTTKKVPRDSMIKKIV